MVCQLPKRPSFCIVIFILVFFLGLINNINCQSQIEVAKKYGKRFGNKNKTISTTDIKGSTQDILKVEPTKPPEAGKNELAKPNKLSYTKLETITQTPAIGESGASTNAEASAGTGSSGQEEEVDVDLSQLQVTLPNVRFDCSGRPEGYYGDPDYRCEVFHYCSSDGKRDTFLCPSNSKFNQKDMTCDSENTDDLCKSEPAWGNNHLYPSSATHNEEQVSTVKSKSSNFEVSPPKFETNPNGFREPVYDSKTVESGKNVNGNGNPGQDKTNNFGSANSGAVFGERQKATNTNINNHFDASKTKSSDFGTTSQLNHKHQPDKEYTPVKNSNEQAGRKKQSTFMPGLFSRFPSTQKKQHNEYSYDLNKNTEKPLIKSQSEAPPSHDQSYHTYPATNTLQTSPSTSKPFLTSTTTRKPRVQTSFSSPPKEFELQDKYSINTQPQTLISQPHLNENRWPQQPPEEPFPPSVFYETQQNHPRPTSRPSSWPHEQIDNFHDDNSRKQLQSWSQTPDLSSAPVHPSKWDQVDAHQEVPQKKKPRSKPRKPEVHTWNSIEQQFPTKIGEELSYPGNREPVYQLPGEYSHETQFLNDHEFHSPPNGPSRPKWAQDMFDSAKIQIQQAQVSSAQKPYFALSETNYMVPANSNIKPEHHQSSFGKPEEKGPVSSYFFEQFRPYEYEDNRHHHLRNKYPSSFEKSHYKPHDDKFHLEQSFVSDALPYQSTKANEHILKINHNSPYKTLGFSTDFGTPEKPFKPDFPSKPMKKVKFGKNKIKAKTFALDGQQVSLVDKHKLTANIAEEILTPFGTSWSYPTHVRTELSQVMPMVNSYPMTTATQHYPIKQFAPVMRQYQSVYHPLKLQMPVQMPVQLSQANSRQVQLQLQHPISMIPQLQSQASIPASYYVPVYQVHQFPVQPLRTAQNTRITRLW